MPSALGRDYAYANCLWRGSKSRLVRATNAPPSPSCAEPGGLLAVLRAEQTRLRALRDYYERDAHEPGTAASCAEGGGGRSNPFTFGLLVAGALQALGGLVLAWLVVGVTIQSRTVHSLRDRCHELTADRLSAAHGGGDAGANDGAKLLERPEPPSESALHLSAHLHVSLTPSTLEAVPLPILPKLPGGGARGVC